MSVSVNSKEQEHQLAALRKQNRTKQIQLQKLQIAHSRQKMY